MFFGGFVILSAQFFLMCINKIMCFVTDDWTNFIVFVLPVEVKAYTFFREEASS